MKQTKLIEIDVFSNSESQIYVTIGCLVESQDGYFHFWPRQINATKKEWYKAFKRSDLIVQLYLIGSLAREDSKDFLSD